LNWWTIERNLLAIWTAIIGKTCVFYHFQSFVKISISILRYPSNLIFFKDVNMPFLTRWKLIICIIQWIYECKSYSSQNCIIVTLCCICFDITNWQTKHEISSQLFQNLNGKLNHHRWDLVGFFGQNETGISCRFETLTDVLSPIANKFDLIYKWHFSTVMNHFSAYFKDLWKVCQLKISDQPRAFNFFQKTIAE